MSASYNQGKLSVMTAGLTGLTIKAMLVTSGYVFNADHSYVADLVPASNELSGTGYAGGFAGSGRKTLASTSLNLDLTGDRAFYDAADLTWTAINAGTAAALILYIAKTSDADSILVGFIDSGGFPKVTSGTDLTVTWSNTPQGVLQVS